jgi:hypothetical protein
LKRTVKFDINNIFKEEIHMSEFSDGLAVGMHNNSYPCVPAYGYGMNGWGNDWWILLLLLCGWGNNGWGGNNNQFQGYEIGKLATTNDVASGFSTSTIMSNQRELQLGQQEGFANVQQSLCQGFGGVNAAINQNANLINQGICNLGYNVQTGFNQLGQQISEYACQTQRAIDGVNFNAERNTRDIIDSQRCGTDRIINFLTTQEMDRLRAENQALRFQASQNAQNAYLVGELRPMAKPAYLTCSPYESAFGRHYGWNACDCDSCR